MRQLKAISFSVFVLVATLIWQGSAIAAVTDRTPDGIAAEKLGSASPYLKILESKTSKENLVRVAGDNGRYGKSGGRSGGGGVAIGVGIAVGIAAISAIQRQKEAERRKKARDRRRARAKKAREKRRQQAARKKKREEQRRKAAAKRKREQAKNRRLARERARKARERKARLEEQRRQREEQNRVADRYPNDKETGPEHKGEDHKPGVQIGITVPVVPLPGVDTREPVIPPEDANPQSPPRKFGQNPPARQQPPLRSPPPAPAVAAANDLYWPREVVVEIDRFQPSSADEAIAQDYSISRLSSDTNALIGSRFVHYRIPDSRTADRVIAALLNDNRVLFAQRNNRYVVNQQGYTKTAASSGLQYALAKIRLASAHAVAQGQGVRVAVIDSGIDREHTDLKQGITAHYDAAPKKGVAIDAHGTAIAGIIRANGLAKGVAPQADILSVRAFYKEASQKSAHSSTIILLRAMDWVAAKRANVVNMSFAGAKDPSLGRAIDKLLERKVHLVGAGGNNGPYAPEAFPAAYDGVIAVTATDTDDKLYTKANRGKYIELAAPGVDVFVVAPKGTHSFSTGTSMAAAHVSGLIALIVQQRRNIDQQAVRSILTSTAIDLGKPGYDAEYGAGRVDAQALIQAGTKTLAGK